MSETICASSSSRSERSERARKPLSITSIITPKNKASGRETVISSRRLRECTARVLGLAARIARQREAVAAAAQGLDGCELVGGVELAPQAPDQHLDHVAVALEVLIVEALGEFGLGDDIARPQHQVLEDAVLEGCEVHRLPAHLHALRPRIEHDRPAAQLRGGPAAGASQPRL